MIRIIQYGLGPIGLESARTILEKSGSGRLELVGAVDIDPSKVGRDLGELLGSSKPMGIVVTDDLDRLLADERPDVVLHTTSSFLAGVRDQLLACVRAGAHVISSTEELFFPFDRHPELAAELHQAAEDNGVVILGTGVNPGFAMDTLALMATGVCTDVSAIHVRRVVDAGKRRLPLQRKIGVGLEPAAFEEKKKTGTFGHVGLRESLLFVADGLGWQLDRTEETLEPVIAQADMTTAHLSVKKGQVAGLAHHISGFVAGRAVLTLELNMYAGADDPVDAIHVEGTPPIDLVIHGGIFGDTATVGALTNAIPLVLRTRPGLRTMKDLPVPRVFLSTNG